MYSFPSVSPWAGYVSRTIAYKPRKTMYFRTACSFDVKKKIHIYRYIYIVHGS